MASSSNPPSSSSTSSPSFPTSTGSQYYRDGYTMAGIMLSSNGSPTFEWLISNDTPSPLNMEDEGLTIPDDGSIIASTNGLVLYRTPSLPHPVYHVSNPFSMKRLSLPMPPPQDQEHIERAKAVALVVNPHNDNAVPDWYVVFVRYGPGRYSYSFDVLPSATMEYSSSSDLYASGTILENTGVSCGTTVYWLTVVGSLVSFEVINKMFRPIRLPEIHRDAEARQGKRQLGRAGTCLSFLYTTKTKIEVYVRDSNGNWDLYIRMPVVVMEAGPAWNGKLPIVCREAPQPLRFESQEIEALVCVDEHYVFLRGKVSNGPRTDFSPESIWMLKKDGSVSDVDDITESLPYLNTQLLPY